MDEQPSTDLRIYISRLDDPRMERNKLHNLLDIVMIVLSAMICKQDSWEEIAYWAELRQEWLATFLELPHGIPSHDTLRRVFERIDPKALQACLIQWINALRRSWSGQVIAIDGKTVRGAGMTDSGTPVLHSVSAFATDARLVLAQIKTQDKSNEIVAIPALLDLIDISGCTISIDAIGCQTKIAESIVNKKADYVLALKANQPNLLENVSGFFESELARDFRDVRHQYTRSVDKGHGRLEIRECWQTDQLEWMSERTLWKGLTSIGMIKRTRSIKDSTSIETQLYISSLPLDAPRFERAVRSHWAIENSLHWVLDVSFGEDACRIAKDHSAENLAILRRSALNLFRHQDAFPAISAPKKRLRASLDLPYFNHVLLGFPYTPPPPPIDPRPSRRHSKSPF
jgi:predicted transposase YbfD/YdcC